MPTGAANGTYSLLATVIAMLASRRSNISPFYAMEMNRLAEERASAGQRVLHLEVGQPSTGAPRGAREAAAQAILNRTLGYTSAPGLPALRARIAQHYQEWYGVGIDPARVMITAGASGGFTMAFLACFDAGQRVGVTEPGYPCYRNTLEALGVTPVGIPVGPDTRYAPTCELLDAAGPLAGVVLASPSNPTGTIIPPDQLAVVLDYTAAHGITVISDEIYHGITYGVQAASALQFRDDAVILNSFSKYFGMTGWRLGWMVVPDALGVAVERLHQNFFICAPHVSQVAGLAAFDCGEELQANVRSLRDKRKTLLDGLRAAGLDNFAPSDGAFYAYVDVSHLTDDSQVLCGQWLKELAVTVTPGIDFDPIRGHHFARFSYSGPDADIAEAMARIAGWIRTRVG